MKKLRIILLFGFFLLVAVLPLMADVYPPGSLLVLCYHSVQPEVDPADRYTISQNQFVEQMEYLRTHDYQPVSFNDLVAAHESRKLLPDKAVLLAFDDGYRSYYDFVVPILKRFGYPSMLAIVGAWIEKGTSQKLPEPLLTWQQVRQVASNPLVTIASHSYDLHKSIQYTYQKGYMKLPAIERAYLPDAQHLENEADYRRRLHRDFDKQKELLRRRIGVVPQAMVWPYGRYTTVAIEVARKFGFKFFFPLDNKNRGLAHISQPERMNRLIILNTPITHFIYDLQNLTNSQASMRAMQVDLDLVYTADSAEETNRNLRDLIDRLMCLKVNTVFLQAFADPDGSGNIASVYFHNRVLPVRADIFSHAVHQMHIHGIKVFAWMPTLSFVFPDSDFNERFRVMEYRDGRSQPSSSWYKRLTPFSQTVARRVVLLFEDLAAGAHISGVLFQDDAYLTDYEDFHPLALKAFSKQFGRVVTAKELILGKDLAVPWMRFKTKALLKHVEKMATAVRKYRPDAFFARNLYAPLLINPKAEQWFAQNYERFLEAYDFVVVMAYPQMEEASRPISWLQALAKKAGKHPQADRKTVFKLQSYDWQREKWLPEDLLLKEMRAVLASGIRHLAYYPDNFQENKPHVDIIQLEMSTQDQISVE